MRSLVQTTVNEYLGIWCEEHGGEARSIAQKALQAQKARLAARAARDIARRKGLLFHELEGAVTDAQKKRLKALRAGEKPADGFY